MLKQRHINLCDFYIFLWLVYYLQFSIFGSSGTIYSQAVDAFLIMVSIYYAVYALIHCNVPLYMKGLSAFLVMITIYGLLLFASKASIGNYRYLSSVYNSLLPIYPFYVFTLQGKLTKKSIRRWTFIFFIAVTILYFQNQQRELLREALGGAQEEEITNNFGYEFLALIPLLMFFSERKIIQYIGMAYIMVFILMAMKRGAILIGAVCMFWFIFVSFKNAKRSKKIGVVIFSLIIVIVGYYAIQYLIENSYYFNHRVESTLEGKSSGRDVIYSTFLDHFLNESNPLRFLFGNGARASKRIFNTYAHNDWLELAINQGVLGIVIYLFYWICFYKSKRKTHFDNDVYLATNLLFIIYFLRTLFSMSYGDMSIYPTSCLGYCLGMISMHDHQIQREREKVFGSEQPKKVYQDSNLETVEINRTLPLSPMQQNANN